MQQVNDFVEQPSAIYTSRLLRGTYIGISYLPWLWLSMFALSVLVTTLQVGHWPSYNNPDPGSGGLMTLVHVPTYFLMLVVLGMVPVWLGLVVVGWVLPKLWKDFPSYIRWYETGIYLSGMGLYYLMMVKDITNLMTWFWD